jgi:hypothetical protein
MFTPDRVRDMSDFLDVEYRPDFSEVRVHESPNLFVPDRSLFVECRAYYDDIYEFCYDRFPQTRDLWMAG